MDQREDRYNAMKQLAKNTDITVKGKRKQSIFVNSGWYSLYQLEQMVSNIKASRELKDNTWKQNG